MFIRPTTTLARRVISQQAARRWASTAAAGSREVGLPKGVEVDPQLNGYPQLPWASAQKRSPFGWWDQQERRNFGETLHEQDDALSMWAPDQHATSGSSALFQLSIAFTGIALFGYLISVTKLERPVSKRSYPFGGLVEELGGNPDLAARAESAEGDDE